MHDLDPDDDRPVAPAHRTGPALPPWLAAARERFGTAQLVAGALLCAGLAVVLLARLAPSAGAPPTELSLPMASSSGSAAPAAGPTATSTTAAPELVVHAAGAVAHPGLYRLPAGSRVADLVAAAGGLADDADADRLNLAAPLRDGAKVRVPRAGEPPGAGGVAEGDGSAASGEGTEAAGSGPLDLNTATADQLDALPGIGPATAKAIVDDRTRNGPFRSVDDLQRVRGIGPAKVEQLRGLVTA